MAQASIILVVKNNSHPLFPECIKSLIKSKRSEFEYIVVDNGSNEQSIDLMRCELKPDKMITNYKNIGIANAFNIGAMLATSPILIFITHDVVPDPTCFEILVTTIKSDNSIGPVGCKLLYPDRKHIQHAGAYLELPRCIGFHFGRLKKDKGQFDDQVFVEYVTGAIFGVSKYLWIVNKGFDNRFFPAYYEDTDFCIRLRKLGFHSFYQPKAVAIHGENSSTVNRPRSRAWLLHLNRFRYVFKHLSKDELIGSFVSEEIDAFYESCDKFERAALKRVYKWFYLHEYLSDHKNDKNVGEIVKQIREKINDNR